MRINRTALAVALLAGTASAHAGSGGAIVLDLTPLDALPGQGNWAVAPLLINSRGDLAGQASAGEYHAARWLKGGTIEDLHPAPGLLASWAKAINDSGVVVGDACIPPPGGNGPCGMYLWRNTPGVGNQQLDFWQTGVTAVTSIFPMRLSNDGGIAMTLRRDVMQGSGEHTVYYRDDVGWIDLSPLVTREETPRTRLIDVNNAGQVLIDHSWGGPLVRWSHAAGVEVLIENQSVFAEDMNDAGQITGSATFPSGSGAFTFSDEAGLVQLDPAGAFPNSRGEIIAESGAIAGYFDGGIFVYTAEAGMQDTGIGSFSFIVGFNSRGDLLANEHHPQTYEGTPKVRFAGQELVSLQELIDPAAEFITITGMSRINDARQFAVLGTLPVSPFTPVAYLVQVRCAADYDANGAAEVADIFAFLADWFAGTDKANVNRDGALDVSDIFSFLTAWFAGC